MPLMDDMKSSMRQDVEQQGDAEKREHSRETATKGAQIETPETSPRGNRFRVDSKHILFGRGKSVNSHPGNQRMRRIIDKYRAEYHESERGEKSLLVRNIHHELTLGGTKFLKRIEGREDEWEEVSLEAAVEKVGHSLRCAKYRPAPRSEMHHVRKAVGNAQHAMASVPQSILAMNKTVPSPMIGSSQLVRQEHSIGPEHMVGITAPLTGGSMAPFLRELIGISSLLQSPQSPMSPLDAYLVAELERSRLRSALSLTPGSLSPSGTLNGAVSTSQLLSVVEQEQLIRQSLLGRQHQYPSSQTTVLLSRNSIQK